MEINLSDHLFVICSHPDTNISEKTTLDCINCVKQLGGEILLSTHFPASTRLINNVDYYIFDKKNPIINKCEYKDLNICNTIFYEDDTYYSEYVKPIIYDYAVFTLIRNAFLFSKGLNKRFLHIINYDCLTKTNEYKLNFIDPLLENDLCYTIWNDSINDLIATYLFSFKCDSYNNLFESISTKFIFFENRHSGWQLEKLFWEYSNNNKLKLFKTNYPHEQLNILSVNKINIFETIFISVDINQNVYIFIKNHSYNTIKFNINFQTYNKFHAICPNACFFTHIGTFLPKEKINIYFKGKLIFTFELPHIFTDFYHTNRTFVKSLKLQNLLENNKQLRIAQNRSEFIQFASWIQNKKIYNLLEIGTDYGGNFHFLSNLENCGIKISIDLPHSRFGNKDYNIEQRNNILNKCPGQIHLINGNSHDLSIYNKTKQILNNNKLDLLFIDGDHTYDGVKQDYEMYKRFVKDGGFIIFHDIVNSNNHQFQNVDVSSFWKNLTGKKIEFISNEFWGGIGVLINENSNIKTPLNNEIININFIQGAFCEILTDTTNKYLIKFSENDKIIHQSIINNNCYTKAYQQFFTKYQINIFNLSNLQEIYNNTLNLTHQKVYIHIDSKSLGDNIAWFPYVEEFRLKHNCKIVCSTFWNFLFKNQYKEIEFVEPGTTVNDIYAMYEIGIFNNEHKEPVDYKTIPLQQVASNVLGLEYKEIKPRINLNLKVKPNIPFKRYVCIATESTSKCKLWNNDVGWDKVVDYLISQNVTILHLGQNKSNIKGVINIYSKNLEEILFYIQNCLFFIGISSGLSWLAWALDKKVIMISGFTAAFNEFQCLRIEAKINTCKNCWHEFVFDDAARNDWNWCPRNKDFECSKSILFEDVKPHIDFCLKTSCAD